MPADQKDITIGFFVANSAQDAQLDLKAFLEQYADIQNGIGPVQPDGRFSYELRDLSVQGGCVQGVFAKFRGDQIPHIGEAGGNEREIEIAENEGLLPPHSSGCRTRVLSQGVAGIDPLQRRAAAG